MERWQLNIVFFVGVGGVVLLLVAPAIHGLEGIPKNPTAVSALGLVLTYLFTQKSALVKKHDDGDKKKDQDQEDTKS